MKRTIDMHNWFRSMHEERGSALVEFAVTMPLLIFLLFAVLEGMFAIYAYHDMSYAAQQGARYAMVRGATASEYVSTPCSASRAYDCTAASSDIQNYVQSLGGINSSNLTVTSNWPQTTPDCSAAPCAACSGSNYKNSKSCLVQVTVSYTFNPLPLLPKSAMTMHATSEKVILQ